MGDGHLSPLLIYCLYRLGGAALSRVPPWLGYRLAKVGGVLAYALAPSVRRRVCDNLRHVLGRETSGPAERRAAHQIFSNLFKNYYDLFRLPRLALEACARLVEVEGWEHIEAGLREGKGLIVTSAHLGNIEIVAQVFALHNVSVTVPVERLQPPQLFNYICRLRSSHGLRLVPVDGPLLELFRALRRGEVLGLAADRDITASGRVVDFFGAPARLPDGHVRIALRTGAPLVCAFGERLPNNRFVARASPPLNLTPTGDGEADVMAGMRQVVGMLEQAIAHRPAQWYVTNAVWHGDNRSDQALEVKR